MITFKEYLLLESGEQRIIDGELDRVRSDIKLTKSQILLKKLQRTLLILKDKEKSTPNKPNFIK